MPDTQDNGQRRKFVLLVCAVIGLVFYMGAREQSKLPVLDRLPRIVNGTIVPQEEAKLWPRSVVLILITRMFGTRKHISRCTGNILDDRTIITAGHCFDNGWHRADIYVGAYNFDDFVLNSTRGSQRFYMMHADYPDHRSPDTFAVAKDPTKIRWAPYGAAINYGKFPAGGVYIHPKWFGDVNMGFDVSLIRLPKGQEMQFTTHIQPIRLEARKIPEYASLIMLGFGRLNRDTKGASKNLRRTHLVKMNTTVCVNLMQKFPAEFPTDDVQNFVFVNNSICAVRYNVQHVRSGQPCNGDSGGSVFTRDSSGRFAIAGVLSWGTPMACTLFTVFERAAYNREWLDQFGEYFNYKESMLT